MGVAHVERFSGETTKLESCESYYRICYSNDARLSTVLGLQMGVGK